MLSSRTPRTKGVGHATHYRVLGIERLRTVRIVRERKLAKQSPTKRLTLAMLTVLVALLASSCSQLVSTGTSAPTRNDALVDSIANDIIFQSDPVTDDPGEAGCIANAVLGTIGSSRLNEAGVTVESANLLAADLTVDERSAVSGVIADCTGANPDADRAINDVLSDDSASIDTTEAVDTAAPAQDSAELVSLENDHAELVDLMVADVLSDPNGPVVDATGARCMVEGTIDRLGLDQAGIEDMAYNDRDATRREHNAMVDAFSVCVDVIADFAAGLEESGFYASEARCVAKQFGRANIIAMMKTGFDTPDLTPAEEVELFNAMDRCGIEP